MMQFLKLKHNNGIEKTRKTKDLDNLPYNAHMASRPSTVRRRVSK